VKRDLDDLLSIVRTVSFRQIRSHGYAHYFHFKELGQVDRAFALLVKEAYEVRSANEPLTCGGKRIKKKRPPFSRHVLLFLPEKSRNFGLIFLMLSLTLHATLSIFTGSFQHHLAIRAIRFSQSSHADFMKNFPLDCLLIITSMNHLHRHRSRTPVKIETLYSEKQLSRLFNQPIYIQAMWSRPEISGAFSSRRWNIFPPPFLCMRVYADVVIR
jgi:hypothetical protein